MTDEHELRVRAYVRVCRDSGFKMSYDAAAKIAASVVGCHPLQILSAVGSVDTMLRIADNRHPATEQYK